MKAAIFCSYRPPDSIRIVEVEKPIPADGEVLLKVRAASVNPLDCIPVATPPLLRLLFGLRKPKDPRLGRDVAGTVGAVGKNVSRFKTGDDVFGVCRGAFAEYACASELKLAAKPQNVTFEQAASVPVAGITALQGLRNKGRIQSGQKVLINGAAGGVGTFAVQLAKYFGAQVTGVCSTRNLEMVRSIGADRVVDYTREDFTTNGERYDLIFDLVGDRSLRAFRRALSPSGTCVVGGMLGVSSKLSTILSLATVAPAVSRLSSRKLIVFLARISPADLTLLAELMSAGKITPVIDRRCTLAEVPEAIRYLFQAHARGKVVVNLE